MPTINVTPDFYPNSMEITDWMEIIDYTSGRNDIPIAAVSKTSQDKKHDQKCLQTY